MENKIRVDEQWKNIYRICGIIGCIAILLGVFDVIFGVITSSSADEYTAIQRFIELKDNPFMGLYHLDIINAGLTLMLLCVYYGIFGMHREVCFPYALGVLILAIVSTVLLLISNSALPMYELSQKYFNTTDSVEQMYFASAGEALLVKGEHGSLGAFIIFFLSTLSGLGMSIITLKGQVLNKKIAYQGIVGHGLMLVYVIFVVFMKSVKDIAAMLAAPGGILVLIWLAGVSIRLISEGDIEKKSLHNKDSYIE